jgi:phage shock protein C
MWSDSTRRYRLYRDPEHGIIAGVCAGIADYLGVERMVVRFVAILGLVIPMFSAATVIAYIFLAIVLKPRPPALFASAEEQSFWRGVAMAPDETVHGLRRKFAEMEERLRRLELQVTSRDFDLHRKFRDLDR